MRGICSCSTSSAASPWRADPGRACLALADHSREVPEWVTAAVDEAGAAADAVLVTPHWGPNMVPAPLPHVRHTASVLRDAGATVVAGHSAHVFHGVDDHV